MSSFASKWMQWSLIWKIESLWDKVVEEHILFQSSFIFNRAICRWSSLALCRYWLLNLQAFRHLWTFSHVWSWVFISRQESQIVLQSMTLVAWYFHLEQFKQVIDRFDWLLLGNHAHSLFGYRPVYRWVSFVWFSSMVAKFSFVLVFILRQLIDASHVACTAVVMLSVIMCMLLTLVPVPVPIVVKNQQRLIFTLTLYVLVFMAVCLR